MFDPWVAKIPWRRGWEELLQRVLNKMTRWHQHSGRISLAAQWDSDGKGGEIGTSCLGRGDDVSS